MINKELYAKLCRRFGDTVRVNNQDQPLEGFYKKDSGREGQSLHVVSSGEEYVLSCPFCHDTKFRLTINHRWGVHDTTTNSDNLWLAQCYRRQCLADRVNQKRLFELLNMRARGVRKNIGPIAAPGTVLKRKHFAGPPVPPGPIWGLRELMTKKPGHPLITYLVDRFFDLDELADVFDIGWVIDSSLTVVRNRLYAPAVVDGVLKGWQCRLVVDDSDAPKWFTMPDMDRNNVLYNIDVAKKYKTIVIAEGPTSAWGIGPQAVATFGKTISSDQIKLLESKIAPDATVCLAYDPDRPKNDKKEKMHHILRAFDALQASALAGRCFAVVLPPKTDPGSLSREFIWQQIEFAAAKAGIPVSTALIEEARKNDVQVLSS